MLVKFFATGTGGGAGPVQYCISVMVPKFDPETRRKIAGEWTIRDPAPQVLAGDPARMTMLIDSSQNKWKYTSGVLAFAKTDAPTDAAQREVMASFERTAFAGLDREQYDVLWIRHQHEGNVELHFVTPRLDLVTGKALNIAPPGHQAMFDAWRDSWNYARGWASPDEPARQRLVKQSDIDLKMDAALVRGGLAKTEDPKRLITEYLVTCVESGKVRNRDDILAVLSEAGIDVNRAGKDYLSVRPEPGAKPVRLKGALYDAGFRIEFDRAAALRAELGIESGRPVESQGLGGSERTPERDAKRAGTASAALARFVAARAAYNARRYRGPGSRDNRLDEIDRQADRKRPDDCAQEPAQARRPDAGRSQGDIRDRESGAGDRSRLAENDTRPISRSLGSDSQRSRPATTRTAGRDPEPDAAIHVVAESTAVDCPDILPTAVRRSLGLDCVPRQPGRDTGSTGKPALDRIAKPDRPADDAVLRDTSREKELHTYEEITPWFVVAKDKAKELYDRARATVIECLNAALDAVRRGHGAAGRAERAVAGAGASLVIADSKLGESVRRSGEANRYLDRGVHAASHRVGRGIKMIVGNRDDELDEFKRDVNLVEYAERQGYELDKRESSRASAVMRRGDDKIVVATAKDGHGIYFSLRNEADNGSIIDFIQKRQGSTLGQVRKELRQWLGSASSSYRPPLISNRKPENERPRKPEPSSTDRQQVLAVWMKMAPANGRHAYLERLRGIDPATLADSRFVGMVRQDAKGNAVFPHYDAQGLAGYELKNEGFTGFSKNGTKAIWHSANLARAERIVIVESAIDALSHAQTSSNDKEAYMSVGGAMSASQRDLVGSVMKKAGERGATVIVATDADAPGRVLAQQIKSLAPPGARLERQEPVNGKDWNDQVKASKLEGLPNKIAHEQIPERERSRGMSR